LKLKKEYYSLGYVRLRKKLKISLRKKIKTDRASTPIRLKLKEEHYRLCRVRLRKKIRLCYGKI
jgi:hypothetical protein